LKNDGARSRINTSNAIQAGNTGTKGEVKMAEKPGELSKLVTIATDLQLAAELRTKAVEQLGSLGTHEALLALLDLAANTGLIRAERELALKRAREIIKSGD